MRNFCFTVDDNIRFFKEIMENGFESVFDHPYLKMYKRLHEKFGLKVQLNLFYQVDGFDLSMMSDKYRAEWENNSDWLKMSFHSKKEEGIPYEFSGYDEVYGECAAVNREIVRFASRKVLADTTTIHFCRTTDEGLKALKDNGIKGLLGLFGNNEKPRTSYSIPDRDASIIRKGEIIEHSGVAITGIDVILNQHEIDSIITNLNGLLGRDTIKVMIHEQYFYPDYHAYQKNFEEKLDKTFLFLRDNGYESRFFEELI